MSLQQLTTVRILLADCSNLWKCLCTVTMNFMCLCECYLYPVFLGNWIIHLVGRPRHWQGVRKYETKQSGIPHLNCWRKQWAFSQQNVSGFGHALQKHTKGESSNIQAEIISVKTAVFSNQPNSDRDCLTKGNSSAKRSPFVTRGQHGETWSFLGI